MKIYTTYKNTISMTPAGWGRFLKRGATLDVLDKETKEHLGYIDPNVATCEIRYTKRGKEIIVAKFTRTS